MILDTQKDIGWTDPEKAWNSGFWQASFAYYDLLHKNAVSRPFLAPQVPPHCRAESGGLKNQDFWSENQLGGVFVRCFGGAFNGRNPECAQTRREMKILKDLK